MFLTLQQNFYGKSCHASPQNSSQIYAYGSATAGLHTSYEPSQLLQYDDGTTVLSIKSSGVVEGERGGTTFPQIFCGGTPFLQMILGQG